MTIDTELPEKLHVGMTRDEVVAIMGKPDDVGGTSRKYRTPCIFVYGDIELNFESWKNGGLVCARKRVEMTEEMWEKFEKELGD